MTEQDYGTIKIPRPAYDHHNERRKELGLTWEQYLNQERVEVSDPVDYAEIENRIERVLKRTMGTQR